MQTGWSLGRKQGCSSRALHPMQAPWPPTCHLWIISLLGTVTKRSGIMVSTVLAAKIWSMSCVNRFLVWRPRSLVCRGPPRFARLKDLGLNSCYTTHTISPRLHKPRTGPGAKTPQSVGVERPGKMCHISS